MVVGMLSRVLRVAGHFLLTPVMYLVVPLSC
jgi:hypothetical protein